jgi:hypothetical protein
MFLYKLGCATGGKTLWNTGLVQSLCDADKIEISSEGGKFGSKKCKRGYGGAYGGVWRSLRLAGIWSQESGFSRHEDVFTLLAF